MTSTVDIIRDVVSDINNTIVVNSVTGANPYTLSVSTTKYLSSKSIITAGGLQYNVDSFTKDEEVVVSPRGHSTAFTFSSFTLREPTFLHGTASSVNSEYLEISNKTREKTPFIWLLRGYTDEFYGEMNGKDRDSTVRLFFMDETNADKWLNDDHDVNAINQMSSLCDLFIDVIQASPAFDDLTNWRVTDRPRFGVEVTNQGSNGQIIDEDLSGVELNITLPIFKICG